MKPNNMRVCQLGSNQYHMFLFVSFSDASFASEKNPDSYQGTMIIAAHKDIANNQTTGINPYIAWQSKKMQRVAVRTLSAEAMALASTTDLLTGIRLYWAWFGESTDGLEGHRQDSTDLITSNFSTTRACKTRTSMHTPQDWMQVCLGKKRKDKDTVTTDCKSL